MTGLLDALAAHADREPERPALESSHGVTTYRELLDDVTSLSHRLAAQGVLEGDTVLVRGDRSARAVTAMLAVLRSGAGYLPVSSGQPDARVRLMVAATAASHVVDLDRDDYAIRTLARRDPALVDDFTATDHLAWTVFTSGSTGAPKGVGVTRTAMDWHIGAIRERFELTAGDRVLHVSSIDFDVAAEELWPTLASGATVVVGGDLATTDYARFTLDLTERRVSVVNLPAGYFAGWARHLARRNQDPPASLRLVVAGSEKLPAEPVRWWLSRPRPAELVNAYGLSETTVTAVAGRLSAGELGGPHEETAPIGAPLDGVTCALLDGDRFLEGDTEGELAVSGPGLSPGYVGDPGQTRLAFFTDASGKRWLRTGDRVVRSGTRLHVVGRVDEQLQIGGRRVEPGDVESAVRDLTGAGDVRVVLGAGQLVGFVTDLPAGRELPGLDELAGRLPPYMVPARLEVLPRMPTTSGGKVDVARLRELAVVPGRSPVDDLPASRVTLEAVVTAAQEVLGGVPCDGATHFFAAGGSSLDAARLVARLNQRYGIDCTLEAVFAAPVLGDLTADLRSS